MTMIRAWLVLAFYFFRDLVLSVKDVVVTVLNPDRPIRSAIIAIPLEVESAPGITLLANMITLTPGTTSLHVSDDGKTLFAHVMNATDDTAQQIKSGFETQVRRVLT